MKPEIISGNSTKVSKKLISGVTGALGYWVTKLLDIIYPPYCETCDVKLGERERFLCEACLAKIILNTPPLCPKCVRRVPFKKRACFECKHRHTYLDQVWAWSVYDGPIKKCLHLFKHKKRAYIIEAFKPAIRDFLEQENILRRVDVLVPVPLHPSNERDRTYNQSELISKALAAGTALKSTRALQKTKKTGLQHFLSRQERRKNIKNAFNVALPEAILGKRILLVDDIFTTGSTMNECARALKEAGARSVYGFALSRGN